MATTSGRARSRHRIRAGVPGPMAEHRPAILAAAASVVVVAALLLITTRQGRALAADLQSFLLYYAGVFALLGLTSAVVAGLVATDRVFLTPGHRVLVQAVHRAISFGALAFLVIHIVTEILAQRVHVIDGVVPFLSPFRRFYIGLGTLAADIIVLLVATSIVRRRFTGHGQAWRWRAVHYAAYLCFITGIVHGLMAGRSTKPYVYWSYGVAVALVGLGVLIRILATSLRPKENVIGPPGAQNAASHTSPLQAAAAAMGLARAQLAGGSRLVPAGAGLSGGYGSSGAFLPLGAPPYGDDVAGFGGEQAPYARQAIASLPAPVPAPFEPGYIGPPRYQGAPRGGTGPQPRLSTGPMPRIPTGPQLVAGPFPRADTGPMPRVTTGPQPRISTGPLPRAGTGPMPRAQTGPLPRVETGPMPRSQTGPMPRVETRSMPRAGTGPMPRVQTGPMPRVETGPMPRLGTGPMPRATGPDPRLDAGPQPRTRTGQAPRPDVGPPPYAPPRSEDRGRRSGPVDRGGERWR